MNVSLNRTLVAAAIAALASSAWAGPEAGDRSLTLSGTGGSDKDFDRTNFGATGELGWFMSDQTEVGVRQNVDVTARDDDSNDWSGATRLFADYHFGEGPFLPYVGANIGGVYGEHVTETFSAGPEIGMKYYVRDKTFIDFQAEYQFLFESADDIDDRFDDGAVFYTLGVGYNF